MILNKKNCIVNKFTKIFSASSLDFDDRLPAVYHVIACSSQETARNWLLECYPKSKLPKYGIYTKRAYNVEISAKALINLAKKHGVKLLTKSDFLTTEKRSATGQKTVENFNFFEQKKQEKLRFFEQKMQENHKIKLQNGYNNACFLHKNGKKICENDIKNNPYLAAKTKFSIEISDNVRINNNRIYIKSENKPLIQIIENYKIDDKHPKITRTCKKNEFIGKRGAYTQLSVQRINDNRGLYIVEGIATAFPFLYFGLHVFWAIDAGNLQHATAEIRDKYPNNKIIICADNDKSETGIKAAKKCGDCMILLPPKVGSDWNDIWLEQTESEFFQEFGRKNNRIENFAEHEEKKEVRITQEKPSNECEEFLEEFLFDGFPYLEFSYDEICSQSDSGRMTEKDAIFLENSLSNIDNNTKIKTINCKYLNDELTADEILIENKITTIKSVQGTGKTTLMMQLIKKIIADTKKNDMLRSKIVVVVKSTALTRTLYNSAKKAGIQNVAYYDDYTSSNDNLLAYNAHDLIFTTPESIYKIDNEAVDCFIIDEAEQVARNIVSLKTHKANLGKNYTKISYLIASSKYCIALDADMGIAFNTIVDDMYTRDFAVKKQMNHIVNIYKKSDIMCNIYYTSADLVVTLIDTAKTENVFIACTSKAKATAIFEALQSKYPEKKGLLITADTVSNPDVIYYLNTMDFTNLNYLCVSPAAATGLDISKHNFTETFASIETIKGITTDDKLQLIQRGRCITKMHVYARGISENHVDDADVFNEAENMNIHADFDDEYGVNYYSSKIKKQLNAEQNNRNELYKIANVYENKRGIGGNIFDESLIRLCAIQKYNETNALCNSLLDFTTKAETKGFLISHVETNLTQINIDDYKKIMKASREKREKKISEHVNSAEILNSRDFIKTTQENKDFVEKSVLVKTKAIVYFDANKLKKETKDKLFYSLYNNSSKLYNLENLVTVVSANKKDFLNILNKQENENKYYYLSNMQHFASLRKLYREIFVFLNIDRKNGKINKNIKWSKENCTGSAENKNYEKIKIFVAEYRTITGMSTETGNVIRSFNAILRKIGIVTKAKQTGRDSDRIRIYCVDDATIFKNVLKYYVHRQPAIILDAITKIDEESRKTKPLNIFFDSLAYTGFG